jgi:hypothetical protein
MPKALRGKYQNRSVYSEMLKIFRYVASTVNAHTGAMSHVHPVAVTASGSASIKVNARCHAQHLATSYLAMSDAPTSYLAAINVPASVGKTVRSTAARRAACGTMRTQI